MKRYVLLLRKGEPVEGDLGRIRRTQGVAIIDQTARRSFLIEAEPEAVEDLRRHLPHWLIAEEVRYDRPEPGCPLPSGSEGGEEEGQ